MLLARDYIRLLFKNMLTQIEACSTSYLALDSKIGFYIILFTIVTEVLSHAEQASFIYLLESIG